MLEQLKAIASKGVESLKDAFKESDIKNTNESPIKNCMSAIENSSLEKLQATNETHSLESEEKAESKESPKIENMGLTDEEKKQIKDESGWSDEIINAISSVKEYEIYKKAGLQEVEIDGRKCLIRNDIDWDQKDSMGRTNTERAEAGLSPINKDGDTIELHHIGQKMDSPLAELTPDEHRGQENYSVLHDTKKVSEIDRAAFNNERCEHWKARASTGE